jgi:phosphatidylglycerophosphatase A
MSPRDRLARILALWFGCGRIPFAPGTAGTLGAIPLYWVLRPHGPWAVAAAAIALTLIGIWAAARVARQTGLQDPQIVVIDEVAGVHVAWIAAPESWKGLILGFVLFRIFDQWKPFPARWVERSLSPGPSIVLDDIVAGIYAAVILAGLRVAGAI